VLFFKLFRKLNHIVFFCEGYATQSEKEEETEPLLQGRA